MAASIGKWSAPEQTPGDSLTLGDNVGVFVIHSTLLHTGSILMWSGHVESNQYRPEAWLWNPDRPINTAERIGFPPGKDIFCSHHAQLPDGRILIVGGAMPHASGDGDARGIKDICVFDSATGIIHLIGQMFEARWYPTLVQMGNGSYVAFAGYTDHPTVAEVAVSAEILHPPFNVTTRASYRTEKIIGGAQAFPTYPGMLLIPGGEIIHVGPNWQYDGVIPGGGDVKTPVQTLSLSIIQDSSKKSFGGWSSYQDRLQQHREEGTFVLLPPAQDGKILVVGGGHITNYDTVGDRIYTHEAGADPSDAEYIDTLNIAAGWQKAGANGKMNFPRINCSAVILADGKVLILGGTSNFKWQKKNIGGGNNNGSIPSNTCEIYDPVTNKFEIVAALNESRTYHSSALLLPDGRVWVAGGVDPEDPGDGNRKTMEFYEPPYFSLARPTILNLENLEQTNSIGDAYMGQEFIIKTIDANLISKAALIRPCCMTHHTDTQQRYVDLPITARGADWIQVQTPTDPSVSPPGYYMVWIIDTQGAPCKEAYWLQLLPAIANFTAGTFNHNGKSFNVHLHNAIPSLSIEGEHFHDFFYDEDRQVWGAHHASFAKFPTLNAMAEYLIDTNQFHAHV